MEQKETWAIRSQLLRLLVIATCNFSEKLFEEFQLNDKPRYLDLAIRCEALVVKMTPENDPTRPFQLSNLGISYLNRFARLGDLEDVNKAIGYMARAVSLTPDGHPSMLELLKSLCGAHEARFKRLGKVEDFDEMIKCKTRIVSVTPEGHVFKSGRLNDLGQAHFSRFERLGKVEDLDQAIRIFNLSNFHDCDPVSFGNLGATHLRRFECLGSLGDLDKAAEYLGRAVSLTPGHSVDMPAWLNNLGIIHQSRFERLGEIRDIDKAIEFKSRAVSLAPKDHEDIPGWLSNLGNAHLSRFKRLGNVSDVHRAVECHSRAVSLVPESHPHFPDLLGNLGFAHQHRFERFGKLEYVDKAIECMSRAVSLAPEDHPNFPMWLSNLGNAYGSRLEHTKKQDGGSNPEDADKAIECHTRAVSLTPKGHADMPDRLNNLGTAHQRRFQRFGKVEDIDKAIESGARAVSLAPQNHAHIPSWLFNLGRAYSFRYEVLGDLHARGCSVRSYREAALAAVGAPRPRFHAACMWAGIAPDVPERLTAYQTAMDLIPHIVWLGTTINQRYLDVQSIGDRTLEAAAVAIGAGKYDLALEWLEQGRSIVWGQTLQLRTPFDDLSSVDPLLAESLQRVANELHAAGSSSQSSTSSTAQSIEQDAQKHRCLADQYAQLLADARKIPGFESFLRPKKASELLGAARTGPVVVVNIHTSRCDALILQPGQSTIGHVPLPDFSYEKANDAREQIQQSLHQQNLRVFARIKFRRIMLRGSEGDGFANALATLWTSVTKPVLDYLQYQVCTTFVFITTVFLFYLQQQSRVDDLPHITWCATGPLSFLPLHASGLYNQPDSRLAHFAISSYTPTLSALLAAPALSSSHSRFLAIGQEATPGQSPLPGTKLELASIKRLVQNPLSYTQIDNHKATTSRVLTALEAHDWVHLSCHAHQDLRDPTESGFSLHDGTLSLAMISQKSFGNKGLAFLSACQTAKGDQVLPDEAVHLASGMLMAGYPSVIATMWSVLDSDAPVVADRVYGQLLKDGKMDYRNAAKALHVAVHDLQTKVGEKAFFRWVPYIHIGV
ncbi:aromatic di-alanine and TPR containing protein [Ceratobasidium theobromae]|uniref:Aromatic di-alanine and TPR containing protein n=1 Tax=Ceratobasidium theobromae TaxID=1582974 RepID=A0A5N5QIU7_9AGAM|nr:aromatic di-alanine and TPR containing protein [Ceratobasidium theobromae]